MPQLVVVTPEGEERRLTLSADEYILGRDPKAPISLPHPKVSRRHARLYRQADGYWIEDLGSSNGVQVDDVSIQGPTAVPIGTRLGVGPFRLQVVADHARGAAGLVLVGKSPPCTDQIKGLSTGTIEVGRGLQCAIVIDDASISRRHAAVHVTQDGVSVEDFGSSNGTWVNGKRVERQALKVGDEVKFGSVVFKLERERFEPLKRLRLRRGSVSRATWVLLALLAAAVVIGGALAARSRWPILIGYARAVNPWSAHRPGALGAEERAYEQEVSQAVLRGQTLLASQSWTEAIAAFRDVLLRDPLNLAGRAGLAQAQLNLEQQAALTAAQQALAQNQPARALTRIAPVPNGGFFDETLAEVADQTRAGLAARCEAEAAASCRRGEWIRCQQHAVCALAYQPRSTVGWAWLEEAENAMLVGNVPFKPFIGGTANRAALAAAYPDAEMRGAILRYATGDFDD
ncbi:MAG TPA: FHA domain-containing protein, partial [Myxococcota bacterium]|nr:FHA domain-containing protein [Myxococcota bacterium]